MVRKAADTGWSNALRVHLIIGKAGWWKMKFQEKIQNLRKEHGLSQEELAEAVGLSRQAITKWETGLTYPDIDNLIALSNYFKVTIDSLLKQEESCSSITRTSCRASAEELTIFLCRAKKKTYAGHGAETTPTRPSSHDLIYQEDELTYIDTYLGGECFSGEEAVWKCAVPVYAMNYSGRVLDSDFNGDFLKEALLLVREDMPFRGPNVYNAGDYSYHCIVNGDVDWFQGYEEIFYRGRKVYECYFHGGVVK